MPSDIPTDSVRKNVSDALAEDIGSGDLTAALIDADAVVGAQIVAREALIVAGRPWVDEVLPLRDAWRAHQRLEEHTVTGRLVLSPAH